MLLNLVTGTLPVHEVIYEVELKEVTRRVFKEKKEEVKNHRESVSVCERLLVALTQTGGLWDLDITILCCPSEVSDLNRPQEGLAWTLSRRGGLWLLPHCPSTEVRPLTPQAQCVGLCLTSSSRPV